MQGAADEEVRFEAHRTRIKGARTAAQPFLGVGVACLAAALVCGLLALRQASEGLILLMTLFMFLAGIANAIAGYRRRRYIRANPLDGD